MVYNNVNRTSSNRKLSPIVAVTYSHLNCRNDMVTATLQQGGNSDPSLHISYIPVEIDEDGLRNLFVDKLPQFKPTRVIVAPLKDGRRHKFGLVSFIKPF